MKYVNGNYYVEVKDERYIIHPMKTIRKGLKEEPNSRRTQNQVQKYSD